jgi:GT2 family glycosyltransferase
VAGAVLNANPESPISVASYVMEFSDFFAFGQPRLKDYLTSCNLSYKMEVFRRYGGFEPDQPLYVDLMFNKRLFACGEKLLFRPDIRVAHRHRATLKEYLDHQRARGRAATFARRKGLLIGKRWAEHPSLAVLAVPALFLRKAIVFPYRFARAYPSSLLSLVRALPYVWAGLVAWHVGFLGEVFSGRSSAEGASGCASN